jgi:hypothetical protein
MAEFSRFRAYTPKTLPIRILITPTSRQPQIHPSNEKKGSGKGVSGKKAARRGTRLTSK